MELSPITQYPSIASSSEEPGPDWGSGWSALTAAWRGEPSRTTANRTNGPQLCTHAVWAVRRARVRLWDHRDVLADRELQCQRRRWLQCAAAQREQGAHARKARTLVRRSQHGVALREDETPLASRRRFFGSLAGWGNITRQPT